MAGLFEKTDSLVSKGVKSAARWSGFAELRGGKVAPPSFYGVDFDFSPLARVLPPPTPSPLPLLHFRPPYRWSFLAIGQACESLRYSVFDHRAEL